MPAPNADQRLRRLAVSGAVAGWCFAGGGEGSTQSKERYG